jgi:beta-N-acetylhexosaminidase
MQVGSYIFGCMGPELSLNEIDFFSEVQPWGFIIFSRNIINREQLYRLTSELRKSVGREVPILIDQEGGRVQRMRSPEWREHLPALELLNMVGELGARAMYLRSRIIASELYDVGIDVNCGPLADILTSQTHKILFNRCYGSDVSSVVEISKAVALGLQDGGVLPVLKHIPGYGRAVVDGHETLPFVTEPYDILSQTDFESFRQLSYLPMAMTAHISYTDIDAIPATVSRKMLTLIREDIGFNNLIMTDDISMGALQGSLSDLSRLSLEAGCDLVLHCNGRFTEMEEVVYACGYLSDQSKLRSEVALSQRQSPKFSSIKELEEELSNYLGVCR